MWSNLRGWNGLYMYHLCVMIIARKDLVVKADIKRAIVRHRRRWEDNSEMYLLEIGLTWDGVHNFVKNEQLKASQEWSCTFHLTCWFIFIEWNLIFWGLKFSHRWSCRLWFSELWGSKITQRHSPEDSIPLFHMKGTREVNIIFTALPFYK